MQTDGVGVPQVTSGLRLTGVRLNIRKIALFGGMGFGILAVAFGVFLGLTIPHQDKALQGTTLAGTDVSNMSRDEITQVVRNFAAGIKLSATYDGQTVDVPLKDIGAELNVDQTVQDVLSLNGKRTNFSLADLWINRQIHLATSYQSSDIQAWLNKAFPAASKTVKDAAIAYNGSQFVVTPSETGQQPKAADLIAGLNDVLAKPGELNVKLNSTVLQPAVSDKAAKLAADYVNARLGLKLNLGLNGKLAFYAEPQDIAAWVTTQTNAKGELEVVLDKNKVEQFLNDQAAQFLPSRAVNKIVFVTPGGQDVTLQDGQDGYALVNISPVADALITAVNNNQNLDQALQAAESGFTTETIKPEGESWIDVNLSTQTTSLYTGNRLLVSYLISSGTSVTPTYPGTFKITRKVQHEFMKDAPGNHIVDWVSYFDAAGRAFHATWWHHNFGHPMSHGCINMTYAAATAVYYFAPVGTKVVIHY
ncbi:L,D-transpeptidase/peptidoglycan binding protein [Candidatus Saccharibacteria bacterium]|nr:L,D-transpeptidase/peptidoglycan binding protein [Candidatus Saccharibacteria bacterium]